MLDLRFRSATASDIDALVRLEEAVERALPHRDCFATDGREFYVPIVAGNGHILLAEDARGEIAGVSVIRYPSMDDTDNLGRDLGLPDEKLSRVRHLESVFVRQDCQGKRLAERLIRENLCCTNASGKNISCATVWPLNIPSLRLHFQLGLRIQAFAFKYGGKPRFILADDVFEVSDFVSASIPCDDFLAHQDILSKGYRGVGVSRRENGTCEIEYRKPRA